MMARLGSGWQAGLVGSGKFLLGCWTKLKRRIYHAARQMMGTISTEEVEAGEG